MIRHFTEFCKQKLKNLSDETIFRKASDSFSYHNKKCPRCRATGKLSPYGSYYRNLVSYENGCVTEGRVRVVRFKCASCGATHALLPDVLIPYSSYVLWFQLTVLLAYLERTTTVVAVCERFHIAVSTLYRWKKNFLRHKDLLLGVITSQKESALAFLKNLLESEHISDRLRDFFHRFAFSFMQCRPLTATRTRPP